MVLQQWSRWGLIKGQVATCCWKEKACGLLGMTSSDKVTSLAKSSITWETTSCHQAATTTSKATEIAWGGGGSLLCLPVLPWTRLELQRPVQARTRGRGGRTGHTTSPPPLSPTKVHFFRPLILHLFQNFGGQAPNSPGVSSLVHISSPTTSPPPPNLSWVQACCWCDMSIRPTVGSDHWLSMQGLANVIPLHLDFERLGRQGFKSCFLPVIVSFRLWVINIQEEILIIEFLIKIWENEAWAPWWSGIPLSKSRQSSTNLQMTKSTFPLFVSLCQCSEQIHLVLSSSLLWNCQITAMQK